MRYINPIMQLLTVHYGILLPVVLSSRPGTGPPHGVRRTSPPYSWTAAGAMPHCHAPVGTTCTCDAGTCAHSAGGGESVGDQPAGYAMYTPVQGSCCCTHSHLHSSPSRQRSDGWYVRRPPPMQPVRLID